MIQKTEDKKEDEDVQSPGSIFQSTRTRTRKSEFNRSMVQLPSQVQAQSASVQSPGAIVTPDSSSPGQSTNGQSNGQPGNPMGNQSTSKNPPEINTPLADNDGDMEPDTDTKRRRLEQLLEGEQDGISWILDLTRYRNSDQEQ